MLLEALEAADVAPGALGYRLLVAEDGRPVVDVQTATDDPWLDSVAKSIVDWVASPNGRRLVRWNAEYPRPNSGFERHTADEIRAAAWAGDRGHVIDELYEPNRIGSQLRAMVYDDVSFVGWLGYYRREGDPSFTERDRRMINAYAGQIHAVLLAIETGAADPCEADFICRADGTVAGASAAGRELLRRAEFSAWLASAVRRVPRDACAMRVAGEGNEVLDVVPVQGESGVSYVVRLRAADRPRRSAWASLTPRQLELARLAVDGLKRREIASRLGLTENTVKTHLKDIYVRLGVSTRSGLVRQWTESPPTTD